MGSRSVHLLPALPPLFLVQISRTACKPSPLVRIKARVHRHRSLRRHASDSAAAPFRAPRQNNRRCSLLETLLKPPPPLRVRFHPALRTAGSTCARAPRANQTRRSSLSQLKPSNQSARSIRRKSWKPDNNKNKNYFSHITAKRSYNKEERFRHTFAFYLKDKTG